MWQCSVMWHSQCLYQYGSALLCDIVNACTKVEVFFCMILSVTVPMWQYFLTENLGSAFLFVVPKPLLSLAKIDFISLRFVSMAQ